MHFLSCNGIIVQLLIDSLHQSPVSFGWKVQSDWMKSSLPVGFFFFLVNHSFLWNWDRQAVRAISHGRGNQNLSLSHQEDYQRFHFHSYPVYCYGRNSTIHWNHSYDPQCSGELGVNPWNYCSPADAASASSKRPVLLSGQVHDREHHKTREFPEYRLVVQLFCCEMSPLNKSSAV